MPKLYCVICKKEFNSKIWPGTFERVKDGDRAICPICQPPSQLGRNSPIADYFKILLTKKMTKTDKETFLKVFASLCKVFQGERTEAAVDFIREKAFQITKEVKNKYEKR